VGLKIEDKFNTFWLAVEIREGLAEAFEWKHQVLPMTETTVYI